MQAPEFVFRSVRPDDFDAVVRLARLAGSGMTTLNADVHVLRSRIELAVASFAGTVSPQEADYLFVLENLTQRGVVGVSALKAFVGLDSPFYNFRLGRLVHSSRELGVYVDKRTLTLTNDCTGSAELCTLFLDPAHRRGYAGKLLSKARLMFAAIHLGSLPRTVIAELRGFLHEDGTSPFWESLGRHFFCMDFDRADALSGSGQKSFIAELMPRYPVYTDFLSDQARACIGVEHVSSSPARRLLEREGFRYEGYVDIFDAGPVLHAYTSDLRLVRSADTAHAKLARHTHGKLQALARIVCSTKVCDFRAIVTWSQVQHECIDLSAAQLTALGLEDGDLVRFAHLNADEQPCLGASVPGQPLTAYAPK